MFDRRGKRSLMVLAGAIAIVAAATILGALGLFSLAIAGLGLLQVATLGLLLVEGPAADSSKRLDALGSRLMAAVETERLDALDRHKQVLDALGARTNTRS